MAKTTMIIIGLLLSYSATADITSFTDSGVMLQAISDSAKVDIQKASMADTADSYWAVSTSDSSSSIATLVIRLAAVRQSGNTFDIFDFGDLSSRMPRFDRSSFFGGKAVTILDDFSAWVDYMTAGNFSANGFGCYLRTTTDLMWYSDTALNACQGNENDIMKLGMFAPGVFGSDESVLAFED